MKSYFTSIISRILILILILNFVSCKVIKQSVSENDTSNSNKPLIAFLNCSISNDSINQKFNIELIDKIITEGKIKNSNLNSKNHEEDGLKYSLLNKNKQTISFFYMQNPLDKTIEYVGENGFMGKKNIRLDSTTFSLRIQLTPEGKYLRFEKDNKQLLLIDLTQK